MLLTRRHVCEEVGSVDGARPRAIMTPPMLEHNRNSRLIDESAAAAMAH